VFFTPYYAASVRSVAVRELLYLQLLVTGSLFILPLLGEEMLPAWCTHPVRTLIAFGDGLLDAAPGILVMTAPHLLARDVPGLFSRGWGPTPVMDQRLAGATMLVIAEIIGLPFLAAVFVAWMRADDAEARDFDRAQDLALAAAAAVHGSPAQHRSDDAPAALGTSRGGTADDGRERPWWETDPRFSDRYR
jgi:cytochrome c oxidase assembly factor CtaG